MVEMTKDKTTDLLKAAEIELADAKKKVLELRRSQDSEQLKDYTLKDCDGKTVDLASLFGDRNDLIVVHNMGKSCPYCTLWADGFNGIHKHLNDRAPFVIVSADDPASVKKFATSRGWKFRMLSGQGSEFTKDMGYTTDKGDPLPGISTFHKSKSGEVHRVTHTWFGPGDDFCAVWPIFDLLKDSSDDWSPKYSY